MIKNILITGRPGCGKSSLIEKLIREMRDKKISGLITPEIREGNRRLGFKIIDLNSKEEEILASVDFKSERKVSKYGVNIDGINKIIDKFLETFESSDFAIVDEIGKMELLSEKFREIIEMILNSNKKVIASITLAKDPFIERIKRRKDVEIFYLERKNFDQIFNEILGLVK
jgi:nucleoside-triphosphatase